MDNLSSILPPIKRHWFPALLTFMSVMGGAALYLLTTPEVYESSVRLAVEDPQVSVTEIGQALTTPPGKVSNSTDPMATQVELVKSQRVLETALTEIADEVQISPEELPKFWELGRELKVSVVPATNIMEIKYESEDPQFAASILNQIALEVVAQSAENIRNEASSVRQFLELQLPEERSKLQTIEARETGFRQTNSIVDVDTQTSQLLDHLSKIQDQMLDLTGQLQEVKTRGDLLSQMTGFQSPAWAYTASRIGQDPELSDLKNRLTTIEGQIIEARAKYQDNQPPVQALAQQKRELQRLYNQRLSDLIPNGAFTAGSEARDQLSQDLISRYVLNTLEVSAIENRLAVLGQNGQQLRSQLATVPATRQRLAGIERERQEAQNNLNLLQEKLQEARIAEAQLLSNVRPISRANVPGSPSGPKAAVVIVLATAAASVLSGSVILLLESLNNTVRNAREIESAIDTPLLGVLPRQSAMLRGKESTHALEAFLNSPEMVEPYRRLLKNIELQGLKPGTHKIIVVSSTTEGEGASDVVARLGAVSSMLSRRTLIVDANLLAPVQAALVEAPSMTGLTHVIEGQVDLKDAIQPTSIKGLDILASGELVARPSAITESPAIHHLLKEVASHYDFVLIDTPPIGVSSDALSIGQHSDGILVIVRPNLTIKQSMLSTMSNLHANRIPVAGIAVNETRSLHPSDRLRAGLRFNQSKGVKLIGAESSISRS